MVARLLATAFPALIISSTVDACATSTSGISPPASRLVMLGDVSKTTLTSWPGRWKSFSSACSGPSMAMVARVVTC
jgi:hypothetical protein